MITPIMAGSTKLISTTPPVMGLSVETIKGTVRGAAAFTVTIALWKGCVGEIVVLPDELLSCSTEGVEEAITVTEPSGCLRQS